MAFPFLNPGLGGLFHDRWHQPRRFGVNASQGCKKIASPRLCFNTLEFLAALQLLGEADSFLTFRQNSRNTS